jgi:RNA polymerase sigma-70 factor, ECF subfamily
VERRHEQMSNYPEDRRLVQALLLGERTAFDEFFREYFPRLYRFVLPRVDRDIQVTEDLCQQVLARALRKLQTFRGDAALFTWLCQIARNELSDHWRQRDREALQLVHLEDDAVIAAVLESLEASEAVSPESRRFGQELGRYVQMALDHLPGRYGDILEWKYVDGLSVNEIAARLNLSSIAAQSILQRARQSFREAFMAIAGGSLDALLNPDPASDRRN